MNNFVWFEDGFDIFLGGGKLGKGNKRRLAKYKNAFVFQNFFTQMVQDAMARYEIVEKGKDTLPDTLSERVILQSLIWYGNTVFFEKSNNIFALPGVPDGAGWNIYGDPRGAWIFSRNGKLNESVKLHIPGEDVKLIRESNGITTGKTPGVIIYENRTRTPFINALMYYCEQISDTIRTLEVARGQLKTPYIIFCEQTVQKTVRDDLQRRKDNEEMILSTGVYDPNKVNVFPLQGASESIPRCIELIEWYQGKWKELCGIDNNSQIDKRGENLIEAELSIGEDYTALQIDKIKPVIEEGLANVKKIFGLDLEIKTRLDEKEKKEDNIINNKEKTEENKNETSDDV